MPMCERLVTKLKKTSPSVTSYGVYESLSTDFNVKDSGRFCQENEKDVTFTHAAENLSSFYYAWN